MLIHLVGGFLGSGKTTAILGASRWLIERGVPVGVITNDQGTHLVDTAFLRASGAAASEVTGGCFCCKLPELERRLAELSTAAAPSVVFAEPVGSCTDLIATVIRPLDRAGTGRRIGSLSVLADIRLIRRRLSGKPLPFSAEVQYIFDMQIEEAGILVLNKADLLPTGQAEEAARAAREKFPDKKVILQNSLDPRSVHQWLDLIGDESLPPLKSADVDYLRYAAGETRLAWYDALIAIDLPGDEGSEVVRALVAELRRSAQESRRPVAHLKVLVTHRGGSFKWSMTASGDDLHEIPPVQGPLVTATINARTECDPEELMGAMRKAVENAAGTSGAAMRIVEDQSFHPSKPVPFKRIP